MFDTKSKYVCLTLHLHVYLVSDCCKLGFSESFNKINTANLMPNHAGIHAREWIAPAVGTYVINELLNGNDTEVAKILDDFDIYAVPALNPDG